MIGVLIGILTILSIEMILRISSINRISYDVTNYPHYTFVKNKKGKEPYYIERLGEKNVPVIKTNSEGTRGKITNNSILCVGCSFTEGSAHKDSETYPGKLQELLKQPVINGGIGGYGLFQTERMVRKLIKYKPKTVIVQLLDFKRTPLNPKKIKIGGKKLLIYQRTKKVSILLARLLKLISRSYESIRSPYMNRNTSKETLWEANKKYLNNIYETCKKNNAKLIFFVWPHNDPNLQDNAYYNKKIKEFCEKNKTHTLDARKLYSYYGGKEMQLKGDAHPSALANKLMAKVTYNYLMKEKLV